MVGTGGGGGGGGGAAAGGGDAGGAGGAASAAAFVGRTIVGQWWRGEWLVGRSLTFSTGLGLP